MARGGRSSVSSSKVKVSKQQRKTFVRQIDIDAAEEDEDDELEEEVEVEVEETPHAPRASSKNGPRANKAEQGEVELVTLQPGLEFD